MKPQAAPGPDPPSAPHRVSTTPWAAPPEAGRAEILDNVLADLHRLANMVEGLSDDALAAVHHIADQLGRLLEDEKR